MSEYEIDSVGYRWTREPERKKQDSETKPLSHNIGAREKLAKFKAVTTEQSKREFFQLVVEKETTKCWSWIGEHDADGRPVFRGEKAYRVMYRLRISDVPDRFHIHHKCENSACVNPRHLVALSPESHRAVHASHDGALRERIYHGEWERIQAEKAQAERLKREQYEQELLEQRRIEAKKEEDNRQLAEAIERWQRDHPLLVGLERAKHLTIGLICAVLVYLLWGFTWSDRDYGWAVFVAGTFWFIAPLAMFAFAFIAVALGREAPVPPRVRRNIEEALISSQSGRRH